MLRVITAFVFGLIALSWGADEPMSQSALMESLIKTLAQRYSPKGTQSIQYYGGLGPQKQKLMKNYEDNKEQQYQDSYSYEENQEVKTNAYQPSQPQYNYPQAEETETGNQNYNPKPGPTHSELLDSAKFSKFCSFGSHDDKKPSHTSLPFLPVVIYNMGPINQVPHQIPHQLPHKIPPKPQFIHHYKESPVSQYLESIPPPTPNTYASDDNDDSVVTEVEVRESQYEKEVYPTLKDYSQESSSVPPPQARRRSINH